jgi:hypothetical protein
MVKNEDRGASPIQVETDEIPKGDDDLLPSLQKAHSTLGVSLQERQGAGIVVGRKETGGEEAWLRRPKVPGVD